MTQVTESESYVLKQLDSEYYQLKRPIKLESFKQGDITCVSIPELEIFSHAYSLNDAVSTALEEMLLLFDVVTKAPIYSVANDEVLSYRRFLKKHVYEIQ